MPRKANTEAAAVEVEVAEVPSVAEVETAPEVIAAASEPSPEAEKQIEVRLLRNYVPENAEFYVPHDEPRTQIYLKRLAGEVLSLPRSEAKVVIAKGIAEITADLV